jgi:4-diphosphocytidyl-2-C-methyl-D-erythritol kinase
VSTALAFRDWDAKYAAARAKDMLTAAPETYTLEELSRVYRSVLGVWNPCHDTDAAPHTSGIVGGSGLAFDASTSEMPERGAVEESPRNGLAEDAFLALVRTGIENDFEEVVFPQYPLLREIKRELMGVDSGAPATYAALSGSGSALFGLYRSQADAEAAQRRVQASGCKALLTETLPRPEYWQKMFAE